MTIKEWAEDYCSQRGMFPDEAKAVVERVMQAPENEWMKTHWSDSKEGFPLHQIGILTMSINRHATEWIEDNAPKAVFKAKFACAGAAIQNESTE